MEKRLLCALRFGGWFSKSLPPCPWLAPQACRIGQSYCVDPKEPIVSDESYVPHIGLLLTALRISKDRLDSRSKVAVPAGLMKKLLTEVAKAMPFDETFYRTAYPDLAEARDAGMVKDLRAHFIETGVNAGEKMHRRAGAKLHHV
jgi:hypothetical protein